MLPDGKKFLASKTIWAGLIIVAYGVITAAGVDLSAYNEIIFSLAGGLGIIGLRGVLGKK